MYRLVARDISHGWCCLGIGQFNRLACHRGIAVGTRRTLASPMLLGYLFVVVVMVVDETKAEARYKQAKFQ